MTKPLSLPELGCPFAYRTARGAAFCGDSLELLARLDDDSVNLVMTSPPGAGATVTESSTWPC